MWFIQQGAFLWFQSPVFKKERCNVMALEEIQTFHVCDGYHQQEIEHD